MALGDTLDFLKWDWSGLWEAANSVEAEKKAREQSTYVSEEQSVTENFNSHMDSFVDWGQDYYDSPEDFLLEMTGGNYPSQMYTDYFKNYDGKVVDDD